STDLGAYGTFISNTVTTLSGGTGTLSGENILWTGANTHAVTTGFFGCTGAICGLLGITEGGGPFGPGPTGYPISVYQAFVASQGVVQVDPFSLGTWLISGGHIDASNMAIYARASANNGRAAWYVFGNTILGAPEPGTFALVLLGIGGLALRSRKAA
ncbi:MAG: PEP-CTERM sorting domain-containing protein, partial [Myxococcota bacterium]